RQRAFSRARFSKDTQDLSRSQKKTDSVERTRKVSVPRAISHSEIANFQNRPHARMLKQDTELNTENMSVGEPRVIPHAPGKSPNSICGFCLSIGTTICLPF